jgi:ABC-type microcin C transport system permease subunit YejE
MEEARRNIKTGGLFLLVGLVSVSPPVLYLAALIGAPVLPQLFFVFGALSLIWGGLKFIQGRVRMRRLRARQLKAPNG